MLSSVHSTEVNGGSLNTLKNDDDIYTITTFQQNYANSCRFIMHRHVLSTCNVIKTEVKEMCNMLFWFVFTQSHCLPWLYPCENLKTSSINSSLLFSNELVTCCIHSTITTIQLDSARARAQQSLQACCWWGECTLLTPRRKPTL